MTTPPYGEYPAAPPGPGREGYPPYPPTYQQLQPRPTNGLAVASLICAFLFFPLGIVFGHMSLSQIKRNNEEGRGLAIAGLVASYVIAALTVLAIIALVVVTAFAIRTVDELNRSVRPSSPGITAYPLPDQSLPPFKPPATLGANCQYPATTEKPSKPATPPRTGKVPTTPATIVAGIVTNQGGVGLQLDNAKAPCTVNNFASLAQQGYFDGTPCHRLTTSPTMGVLQCGDPSGSGTGGPGYRFPNEYPTNQYRITDPALESPVLYPRGTLAMANSGLGTNGSQFFLVYRDSLLPPTYTVFGSIDRTGLATLDKVAAGGVAGGSEDGKPATTVTIESVRVG